MKPQPRFPTQLSRIAVRGEIFCLGMFMPSGSPAPEKEAFAAFYTYEVPDQVACICDGDVFKIISPGHQDLDGRIVVLDTGTHDIRSMKQRLPTYVIFLDTKERIKLEEMPMETDVRWQLIKESDLFRKRS